MHFERRTLRDHCNICNKRRRRRFATFCVRQHHILVVAAITELIVRGYIPSTYIQYVDGQKTPASQKLGEREARNEERECSSVLLL